MPGQQLIISYFQIASGSGVDVMLDVLIVLIPIVAVVLMVFVVAF